MQSHPVGFSASRLVMVLSLTLAGTGVLARDTKAEDHTAHHPAEAASAPKQSPKPTAPKPAAKPAPAKAQPAAMDKGSMEKMGQMDAKMKAMQEMRQGHDGRKAWRWRRDGDGEGDGDGDDGR